MIIPFYPVSKYGLHLTSFYILTAPHASSPGPRRFATFSCLFTWQISHSFTMLHTPFFMPGQYTYPFSSSGRWLECQSALLLVCHASLLSSYFWHHPARQHRSSPSYWELHLVSPVRCRVPSWFFPKPVFKLFNLKKVSNFCNVFFS